MKQKPSFRLYWNRFRYWLNSRLFVYGVGPLARKYDSLTSAIERAEFAAEHFGKVWLDVLGERYRVRDKE